MEICPYCGTRNPGDERCPDCGGILDDLSMMATQIAMGPWYFRTPGKPYGPGCDISILRRMISNGRIKPDAPVRGPTTHQFWRRVRFIPGIAHLAGVCHNCGSKVKADDKFCHDCGARFAVPETRDDLGLPDRSATELIDEYRAKDGPLCPVCGHDGVRGDECSECGCIFAPPEEATPITIGGWFIHGKAYAHKPGMSFEQLKKEIALGSVTGRTIVRGPTTEQFWQLAKATPGVAALLGVCHRCGTNVQPGTATCPACNADLSPAVDPSRLGLRYRTAAEAAEAQKQLDAELQKLGVVPGAVPAPAPARAKAAPQSHDVEAAAAETTDEIDDSYSHAAAEHDVHAQTGHMQDYHQEHAVHAGYAQPYADPHAYEATPHAPAESQAASSAAMVGQSALDASPRADAGLSGADRRRLEALERSRKNLVLLGIGSIVLLALVIVLVNFLPGKGSPDPNKPATDPNPQANAGRNSNGGSVTPGPAPVRGEPHEAVKQKRADAEKEWAAVKDLPRKGQFIGLLAVAELAIKDAHALYDKGDYLGAQEAYPKVAAAVAKVLELRQQQLAAEDVRNQVASAIEQAKQLEAPAHAQELFAEAEKLRAEGDAAFDAEKFDQAIKTWDAAIKTYGNAGRFVQAMRTAADKRQAVMALATKVFPREELDRENIPAWQAFVGKMKEGDDLVTQKAYLEAMQFFEQAEKMVPSVEFAMKLHNGRMFYAYQLGKLTARILMPKVAGHHPDEEMLAELKRGYENLQINRDFYNRIPLSKNTPYKEMADIMVIDCGKEIESTFEGSGPAVKAAFALGLQFIIVDRLLRVDIGKISEATRAELKPYLTKVMPDNAKLAGCEAELAPFFKDVDETLATEVNIPVKTREKWQAMMDRLDRYETAMKILPARPPVTPAATTPAP